MGAGESIPQQQGPTTFENPYSYQSAETQQTAEQLQQQQHQQEQQQQAYAAYEQYQQEQQQWTHQHAGYEHGGYQYGTEQDHQQQQQSYEEQAAAYQEYQQQQQQQQQYAAVSQIEVGQDVQPAPATEAVPDQQPAIEPAPFVQQQVTDHHQQHTFSHSDPSGTYGQQDATTIEAQSANAAPEIEQQEASQEMPSQDERLQEPELQIPPKPLVNAVIQEPLIVASPHGPGKVLQEEAAAAFQRLRREKEKELNEIQSQYSRRLRQAEDEFSRITRIQEDEYQAAIDETSRLFIDPPSMVCEDQREMVRDCYKRNKGHALNCFRIVQDFFNCVSCERGLIVHRSVGARPVAGSEEDGDSLGAASMIFQ